jgi:hypothetical protein
LQQDSVSDTDGQAALLDNLREGVLVPDIYEAGVGHAQKTPLNGQSGAICGSC